MQNAPGEIPASLAQRRIQDDFASERRDIDLRAGGIAKGHSEQGPVAVETVRHSPLIVVPARNDRGPRSIDPPAAGVLPRDSKRNIGRRDSRVPSVGGADRAHKQDSLSTIDRHQPGKAFRFRQRRKRNEVHHDPGREPHREQQAERDPKPAVQQDNRAHMRSVPYHLNAAEIS